MINLTQYALELKSEEFFYGRDYERGRLTELLDKECPLIVIRGPPAIGKSTLTSKVLLEDLPKYARQALNGKERKYKIIDIEVERGDELGLGMFFRIINQALDNPANNDEVDERLKKWYRDKDYEDKEENPRKEFIKSMLWSYYPFEGYSGSEAFSNEDLGRLLNNSLGEFFSSYNGDEHLIIRIQNFERRLLGDYRETDELIKNITDKLENRVSFIVETREDDLSLKDEGISLTELKDFPIREYAQKVGVSLTSESENRIRKMAGGNPYIMELWPFFFMDIEEKRTRPTLEYFLDKAIKSLDAGERELLNLISLPQKPVPLKQISLIAEALKTSQETLKERILRLIKKHLVSQIIYTGEPCLSAKNPRLGERATELTDKEEKIRLHRVLYETSDEDNLRARFFHSLEGKMPDKVYEAARAVSKNATPAEAIKICDEAIELLKGDESSKENLVRLIYFKAGRKIDLGNYNVSDSLNRIRLSREGLPDNPDFDWAEDILYFTLMRGLGNFSIAQKCIEEAKKAAAKIAKLKTTNLPQIAEYNHHLLTYYRCWLDTSLSVEEKRNLLEDCVEKIESQIEKSPLDENLLASSLKELSKYKSDSREDLLDSAEEYAKSALRRTPRSHKQTDVLVTLAEIYQERSEFKKASEKLDENEKISEQYGVSRKTRFEHLLVRREIAKAKGSKSLERECNREMKRILDTSNPRNFLGLDVLL